MKTYQKILSVVLLVGLTLGSLVAQELTVYVLPSPVDRTWDSPREIILSTVKNLLYPEKYKKHYLGHVFIQLSNEEEKILTGSAPSKDVDLKSYVLSEGYGLGVLNANIKGRLEKTTELSHELAMRYKHGNISFIRFKISPEMYDRLKYYLEEYDKRDYDTIYNGQNKPREGKGAGCSAFAVSFLEVAGFFNKEWESKWVKRVKLPLELIGNKFAGHKVSAWKVMRAYSWAKEDQPHVETCFYDPNAMHLWILEQCARDTLEGAQPVLINKAVGIEYDYTQSPCPDEAVFKKASDDSWVVQE